MSLEPERVQELIAELRDADYHIRIRAALELGAARAVEAIPMLIVVLGEFDKKDEDSQVNFAAVSALADIGEAALDALSEALLRRDAKSKRDGWRRHWLAQALGEIGNPKVVNILCDCLLESDKQVVSGAAEALGRIGDPAALDALARKLSLLKREDGWVYTAVEGAIDDIIQPQFYQCRALTERGSRCTEDSMADSIYCELHAGDKPPAARPDVQALRKRVQEATKQSLDPTDSEE